MDGIGSERLLAWDRKSWMLRVAMFKRVHDRLIEKDENVIAPAGQPFYAPTNASYPTKGRITEVMSVLSTMGARLIRSQTMGVSVGNPLSVMPSLGVYNEKGKA